MEEIDLQTLPRPSTIGTGGGTEYDDGSIRARPNYRWEGIWDDPLTAASKKPPRRLTSKLAVWFGIRPTWVTGDRSHGLSVDVKLESGSYVLLEDTTSSFGKGKDVGRGSI